MGGWRERQDNRNQAQTDEPVEDHGREIRSASAAAQPSLYPLHAYSRDDLIVDSASREPPRAPDLFPLPERLHQRRLHQWARLALPARPEDRADDTLDAEPGVLPSRIAHLGRRGARRSAARSGGRSLRPNGHLIASGLIELGAVWARPAFDGVVFPIVFILPAFPSSEKEREGD